MKVGVYGATGMLGHHTAAAVHAAGHDLYVIHRDGSDLSRLADLQYTSLVASLGDLEAMTEAFSGMDCIVNCAAPYPTVPRPWQQEVAEATARMAAFYDACGAAGVGKIVYLGGAIALRRDPSGKPGNESLEYASRPPTNNAYVQVKWAMHRQAKDRARQGLPVVIGIPTMTFGEYDYGPSTGRFITEVANQTMPGFVDGRRNVIYAGDAGRGLLATAEKGRPGETYLLTGSNITMDQLMDKIASVAGVDKPGKVPLFMAKMLGRIQALRYRLFNGPVPKLGDTAIAVMSSGQFIDGSKAENELGFKAEVSLDEALERAYRWFVDVGMIGSKE